MITSEKIYNEFAPYYRDYYNKKIAYIKSIDKLIIKNLPLRKELVLDVGCGDGVRGINLFKKIKAKKILMIDNSDEMIKLAKKFYNKKIEIKKIDISIKNLKVKEKFDIILCLWNVLGHIPDTNRRIIALKNMKQMLKKSGKIFIDVSNRYNIRYYSFKKVLKNFIKDFFKPNVENGDFNYKIKINNTKEINSLCHFFTPKEVKNLINISGLKIESEYFIDYINGKIRRFFFEGHLFYILVKK